MRPNQAFALSFILLLGALTAFLYFLAGHHGHHPTDDGFMLAYAWRSWNGQLIYRDYVFLWTPLTPLLHQWWFAFPNDWSYSLARFGFLVQMVLGAGLWGYWYFRTEPGKRNALTISLFGAFALLSIGNFPPMPWYTSDGVLACHIGAVLFLFSLRSTKSKNVVMLRSLAGAAFLTAAFFKQNFIVLYVLFTALNGLVSKRDWKLALKVQALSLTPLLALSVWLFRHNLWLEFFANVSRKSTGSGLFDAGVLTYFQRPFRYGLALFLGFLTVRAKSETAKLVPFVSFFALLTASAVWMQRAQVMQAYAPIGVMFYWWAIGLALSALQRKRAAKTLNTADLSYYLLAFAIPWTGSISYGWKTPWLGIAALAPLVADAILTSFTPRFFKLAGFFILSASMALAAYLIIQFPYRETPRAGLTKNLGDLYPAFGNLLTNEATYRRYSALKEVSGKLREAGKSNLVVYPEFPLFYFLERRHNPTSLDWYYPMHYQHIQPRFENELAKVSAVVILENIDVYRNEDTMEKWILEHSEKLPFCAGDFCAYQIR